MSSTSPEGSQSLTPLPPTVHSGLSAVTAVGLLSLLTTSGLFAHLAYHLTTWKPRAYARLNLYLALLLLNLVFADFQQALGFVLSLEWLRDNGVFPLTTACWTQAWLLNAGEVGRGMFTLAMAGLLFADVVFEYRPDHVTAVVSVVAIWMFNYLLATIGVVFHPRDFYLRAGMWCWINETYMSERLWFHYLWILLPEFAVVVVCTLLFIVLWRRIQAFFHISPNYHLRAKSTARTVAVYALVYVICTLPAVVARLRIMTGHQAGYVELTVAGVMMTSNGWLDVLVYLLTRQSPIFILDPAIQNETHNAQQGFTTSSHCPQYGPNASCDRLTDLGPLSRSNSTKAETVYESGYYSRQASVQELSLHGGSFVGTPPPKVMIERPHQDLEHLRIPEIVLSRRSEGDLRKPGLRFPRRHDPLQNVRYTSDYYDTQAFRRNSNPTPTPTPTPTTPSISTTPTPRNNGTLVSPDTRHPNPLLREDDMGSLPLSPRASHTSLVSLNPTLPLERSLSCV